jgi:hypothetical protein
MAKKYRIINPLITSDISLAMESLSNEGFVWVGLYRTKGGYDCLVFEKLAAGSVTEGYLQQLRDLASRTPTDFIRHVDYIRGQTGQGTTPSAYRDVVLRYVEGDGADMNIRSTPLPTTSPKSE